MQKEVLNEFYIYHRYKKLKDFVGSSTYVEDCALKLESFVSEVVDSNKDKFSEDIDCAMDEALFELSDMNISQFEKSYPDIYKKYYTYKMIDSKHISISYDYGLVAPIEKIYVSEDGFSISDIAETIRKQYRKYHNEYNLSKRKGKTPKYLSIPVQKHWNVRFDLLYKPLNMKNECWSCYRGQCGVCSVRTVPHVMVRVDT